MTQQMTFEAWLQSRLTAHGFPCGPIDGTLGPATHEALGAFQTARGLPVTKKADEATVAALRLSATSASEPMPERDEDGPETPVPATVSNVWPRQKDVPLFYGAVGQEQVHVQLAYPMRIAWNLSQTVNRITMHRRVAASAERCFQRIAATYTPEQRRDLGLDLFGGSLNVRKMRGGSSYSMHSWGIAIDFDPERNQLKWGRDRARLAQPDCIPFWEIWEAEGWVSLGRVRNFDWMHVQAARL